MGKKIVLLCIIMMLVLTAAPAYAGMTRTGDNISLPANRTINDDVYVAGNNITIQSRINGDLLCGGNSVTIDANVADSLAIGGNTITINGPVGNSVRVAGQQLTVISTIGRDLLYGGNMLLVTEDANIRRDAWVAGNVVTINGPVGRNVKAAGSSVTINGRVGGDVIIDSDRVTIGSNAVINGDLRYTSTRRADIDPGAQIEGRTIFKEREKPKQRDRSFDAGARIGWFLLSFLAAYLAGVLLLLLFPRRTRDIAETILNKPLPSLGIGFLTLIVVPIAAVILLIFIITIPISIIVFGLYMLGIYLAKIYAGLALGRFASSRFGWKMNDYLALLVGLFILMLLGAIPWLGGLVRFVYILLGLGAAVISIYYMISSGRTEQAVPATTDVSGETAVSGPASSSGTITGPTDTTSGTPAGPPPAE